MLSIAAEDGDSETVRTLLKLGFNVHNSVNKVTAMDLAYNNRHYDVMLELLINNSLYPENFSTNEVSDELKAFVELGETLHKAIIAKDSKKVLEILNNNLSQKFFYDTCNNSALTYALVRKSFKVYEIFLVRNFSFGPFEQIDEILDLIKDDARAQRTLKIIHQNHAKPLIQKHIMILLSNSSMGHDGKDHDPDKIARVTEAYQTLDKHPALSQLLKVIAAKRNFLITFDFNHKSIRLMDPSIEGYVNGLFRTNGKV